jgi:ribosomal protein S18 acetylase RimI-like enzyme
MTITYLPAATLSADQLAHAFNAGYSGYYVPIAFDAAIMQDHIFKHDIDLTASRVASVNDEVVGICLLGVRGTQGWIGGVGVSPSQRRLGIGRGLMEAVHDSARVLGLNEIMLEVLEPNGGAKALYEQLGYAITRRLLILESPPTLAEAVPPLDVYNHPLSEVLTIYEDFHRLPNPWQRAAGTLRHHPPATPVFVAYAHGAPSAYAVARVNEKALQWLDLAYLPGHETLLRALVLRLHEQYPLPGRLVNLGEDDPVWAVLQSLGYRETLAQWEMRFSF